MNATPSQDALEDLARNLGEALAARGWRMASAESCTGGWIAQCMTAIAGSSAWFEAGFVTYSNAAKVTLLGVDPALIERHGAVSAETAQAMALGALDVAAADIACAVTGIAGPSGGSGDKPVGTVWFGFASRHGAPRTLTARFAGGRREVRAQAVAVALSELIAMLD